MPKTTKPTKTTKPPARPIPVTAEEVLSAATANAQEATKRMASTEVEVKKLSARLDAMESRVELAHRSAMYAQEQLLNYKRYCLEGRARHLLDVVSIVHRSVKANADRLRCETIAAFGPTPPVRPSPAAASPMSDAMKVAMGSVAVGGISALLWSGLIGGALFGASKRGAVQS